MTLKDFLPSTPILLAIFMFTVVIVAVVWIIVQDTIDTRAFEQRKEDCSFVDYEKYIDDVCNYYKCVLQGLDIEKQPTRWRNYNDAYQTCLLEEK